MFILIDNYDSFTYNLYHYLGELGARIEVHRNDQISVKEVMSSHARGIIISPGPCDPDRAGICLDHIEEVDADFEHLLVAPHHLRNGFNALIDAEAAAAEQGRPSGITVKMNSLQDRGIIERLYEASASGVPIKLVIRGICCLRPGVEGLSASIEGRSIVDRFLEHSRVFLFHADGADKLYLASADWMTRNLERRVEVAFPIYDDDVRAELRAVLDLQLEDNTKARIIDAAQRNEFVTASEAPEVRSQIDTYRYLEGLLEAQSFREQG